MLKIPTHCVLADVGTSRIRLATLADGVCVDQATLVAWWSQTHSREMRRKKSAAKHSQRTRSTPTKQAHWPWKRIAAVGDSVLAQAQTQSAWQIVAPVQQGAIADAQALHVLLQHLLREAFHPWWRRLQRVPLAWITPPACESPLAQAWDRFGQPWRTRRKLRVDAPWTQALGSGLDPQRPLAQAVVDLGAGHTAIAVYSLGSLVAWAWSPLGGEALNHALSEHMRHRYQISSSPAEAERVKCALGSLYPGAKPAQMLVKGHDLRSGAEKQVRISDSEIRDVLLNAVEPLALTFQKSMETLPPELASDLVHHGICLVGGGAQLQGVHLWMEEQLQVPCRCAEEPQLASIRGGLSLLTA